MLFCFSSWLSHLKKTPVAASSSLLDTGPKHCGQTQNIKIKARTLIDNLNGKFHAAIRAEVSAPAPSAGLINGQLNLLVTVDTLRPWLCPRQFVPPLPGLWTASFLEERPALHPILASSILPFYLKIVEIIQSGLNSGGPTDQQNDLAFPKAMTLQRN